MKIESKADYLDYLKSPEWQAKSRVAKERAGWSCQLCGATHCPLHCHHRDYSRVGAPSELQDVIVLCDRCHQRVHECVLA